MGDGVGTSSNVSSWDCINTPQALICGASSFDGGDVPMSFEATNAAAHYYQCPSVIRFGTLNPTANNGSPGNVAPQADNMGSNGDGLEEDGVATLTTYAGSGTYSFTTSAFNNTGSTANVYAWVDWNGDGLFSASEIQTTTVPSGAAPVNRTFTWNAIAAVTCGKKYVRLRITNDALTDNVGTTSIDERSRGPALSGEVEDYFVQASVTIGAGPDQVINCSPLGTCSATMAGTGIGLGTWIALGSNPGTATITTPSSATTTITTFSAYGNYGFRRVSGTCEDTVFINLIRNQKPRANRDT
jgi:hypothetical protein